MIEEFQGEYRWLSNLWPVEINFKDKVFYSVEHAYMAQKNLSEIWQEFCTKEPDPKFIKKMSYEIQLRPDWDEIKVELMKELVLIKFENKELAERLVRTGDTQIQEGNTWGDTFWGVNLETGEGNNVLGKIIMDVRSKII